MTIRKVRKGEPLSVSARDWNKIADAVNVFGNQSTPGAASIAPGIVIVKNTLGRDLNRYDAVCVGSPTPTELHTGKNDQVFLLVNGSIAGREGSVSGPQIDHVIGILQEPIANNRFGQVMIDGVTPARFRAGESGVQVASIIPPCATISDLDDALVFAQVGPVRMMHRNLAVTGTWSANTYRWVKLDSEPTIGSVVFRAVPGTITGWAAANFPDIVWQYWKGDVRGMGVVGSDDSVLPYQKGRLQIRRKGRYHVVVRWGLATIQSPSGGYLNGDRIEVRVTWDGIFYQDISTPNPTEFFSMTPNAWVGQLFSSHRSWYLDGPVEIPMPTIEAKKIARLDGAITNLTVGDSLAGGHLEVEVIRLGSEASNGFWSKALADAAFARGASAGPI